MSSQTEPPVATVPTTRIITLLEANDISNSELSGQWNNNLEENTILKEGDVLTVRNSMIDTTTESSGVIEVLPEESDITFTCGMYLQDSGDGSLAGGDNAEQRDAALKFAGQSGTDFSPSAKNFILQNQFPGLPSTNMWYTTNPAIVDSPINPASTPTTWSLEFYATPSPSVWYEYTLETGVTYLAPIGAPFPNPPDGSTSPILLPANLTGCHAILFHQTTPTKHAYFKIYANGWNPVGDAPDPETDHIAIIETLYDSTGQTPIGYQSTPNPNLNANPAVGPDQEWVFRTAVFPGGGGSAYQYWMNTNPAGGDPSKIFRICTAFRLIVDDMSKQPKSSIPERSFYQTALSYTTRNGGKETVAIKFDEWGHATTQVYGTNINTQRGLFLPYQISEEDIVNNYPSLPNVYVDKGRGEAGFKELSEKGVTWVEFKQMIDPQRPTHKTLEPFTFDINEGITVLKTPPDTAIFTNGFAFGMYTMNAKAAAQELVAEQIDSVPAPQPSADGCLLTPRLFTTKIHISHGKYTYDSLAQTITDKLNQIPREVPALNNNPDSDSPPSNNLRGFSGSRLLTSTYELGMQQSADTPPLPQFPSDVVYDGSQTLLQPVWVSEDGLSICQWNEADVEGTTRPRWAGAEAVSFIYDETSDSFQIAQAHSNLYSRLDGGIVARQFKSAAGANLITADKAGGIFFTNMEPATLFFDKMKLNQHTCLVQQLTNNPRLNDFTGGGLDYTLPSNAILSKTLAHTINLIPAENITGNFIGLTTKIDKRTRILADSTPTPPIAGFNGGFYGYVDTDWALDIGINTPITIRGTAITAEQVADPFFQVEISGINKQDIVGANIKNNLIQTIVGKYYSNGQFTTGQSDDGFSYTHLGEPMLIRSMGIRILDSTGHPTEGLGNNSAIILELNSNK